MTRPAVATIALLVLTVGALVGLACARTIAGMALDEVSEVPIAFVYWEPEDARRRQELIDEARNGRSSALPTRVGVATAEGIASLFGRDPALSEGLGRFPGRVAFLNARTGELKRFEGGPANARPLAWSPDRTRLLFASAHIGREFQLYEYDLETDQLRTLSRGPAMHLEGDYAADGRLLMTFIEQRRSGNSAGMWLTDPYGAGHTPVVDGSYPSSPRFSPADETVVYVRAVNRAPRTGQTRDQSVIVAQEPAITDEPHVLTRGREPVFMPDGSGIVYTAETTAGWRLQRMRIDGGGRARLGGSIRDERMPAVSPDGRHVVYVSPGDDRIERLYIRRIDGSGDRILLGEGAASWPVW